MPPKGKGKKKEASKEEPINVPPEKHEPTEREIQLRSQYVNTLSIKHTSVINFVGEKFMLCKIFITQQVSSKLQDSILYCLKSTCIDNGTITI